MGNGDHAKVFYDDIKGKIKKSISIQSLPPKLLINVSANVNARLCSSVRERACKRNVLHVMEHSSYTHTTRPCNVPVSVHAVTREL